MLLYKQARGNPIAADRQEEERMRNIKRIINRLVEWLEANGISNEKIVDCIQYITK